jgi:hypothetical protein
MQPDVKNTTETLVKHASTIGQNVGAIDKYMQTYAADSSMFVLPKVHKFMEPVVKTYAANLEGFVEYIVQLRDYFAKGDQNWLDLQAHYRRVNGRLVQQQRRERANRACVKADELYGPTDYHSRLQWVSDLEHGWAKRRLKFLDDYRGATGSNRLDVDTRAEALAEFWDDIDTEIFEGKGIPPWN